MKHNQESKEDWWLNEIEIYTENIFFCKEKVTRFTVSFDLKQRGEKGKGKLLISPFSLVSGGRKHLYFQHF